MSALPWLAALLLPAWSPQEPTAEPWPGVAPDPRLADPGPVDLATVLDSAVAWLVANQRPDGAWGSHHSPRPIEVLCDVPGSHHAFRVATTALCVMALGDCPVQTEASLAARDRGVDSLLADWNVQRPSGFEHYSVWAFGYCLQALAERLLEDPEGPRAPALREVCARMVDKLARYQCLDGGWGYLSLVGVATYPPSWTSMSFTTASILVGLHRAREAGIDVPDRMIDRAVASVQRCKTPTGSYTYGEIWNEGPAAGINQRKGGACRTPACDYAVGLFRRVPLADYTRGLQDLLVDQLRFQVAALRRPIPHESHYQVSGYFYLFGCAYAAWVLETLPDAEQAALAPHLARAVLVTREPDGSFWDYPLYSYHKPYGTAFAVLALSRVAALEGRAGE